jgi:hypothetical protein
LFDKEEMNVEYIYDLFIFVKPTDILKRKRMKEQREK